jgi:cell division protein FtsQ
MANSKAYIIGVSLGVTFTAIILIAAVVCGYVMKPMAQPCQSIEFIIEDADERMYVTDEELTQLLIKQGIHPTTLHIDSIGLYLIERAIKNHPMVQTAECYLTSQNEVKVSLRQRVPILRVQTPKETYFIDSKYRKMPMREAIKDEVLVASGNVEELFAASELADFALWLQDSKYWRERIKYVHIETPQMVFIYLCGDSHPRIMMGTLRDYERKLAKLRTFLERGQDAIGNKIYHELDVRFNGQVIGRY